MSSMQTAMSEIDPVPSETPLKGFVFYLDPGGWGGDSVDAHSLRKLGAKVVNRAASTITHVVTAHVPPRIDGDGGWMGARDFARYKGAVAKATRGGRGPYVWSGSILDEFIADAFAARNAYRKTQHAAQLAAQAAYRERTLEPLVPQADSAYVGV